jgi:hypothetical protein
MLKNIQKHDILTLRNFSEKVGEDMKYSKKEMKEVLAIIKRLIKDKKNGIIAIQSKGDMRIHIMGQSVDGHAKTYHTITSLNDESYSFQINPYDLDIHSKSKEGEIEFTLSENSISLVGGKNTHPIFPFSEDIQFHFDDLKEVENPKTFIEIMKGSDTAMKSNKDLEGSYLKITSEKVLAATRTQIHLFRMDEELPFNSGFLHKDYVSLLAKSIKGDFQLGMLEGYLVFWNKNTYYLIKVEDNILFPSFRNMTPLKRDIGFTIDADQMNESLKDYTKKQVSQVMFTQQGDFLIIDPRNPDCPTHEIEINVAEGNLKKAIFVLDDIKSFFSSYKGIVQLEQQQFKNVYGTIGYLWRIYTKEKLTMISGIEEPDWVKIESYFNQGKIKELSIPTSE